MRRVMKSGLALVATLALGACGGSSPNNGTSAANDVSPAENMAMDNGVAPDGANPFADAEQRMNQAMMAAVGTDAGDSWTRKMIVHHQGAIDMSRIVLQQNPPADVAAMARDAIDKQTKEVATLQKMVRQGAPDPKSAEIYRAASTEMQQAMMNAKGTTVAETFMRKMLAHHKGGVALSDVALRNGVTGPLKAQVEKTRAGQQQDSEMTERMLRGEPMKKAGADAPPSGAGKSGAAAAGENKGHDMSGMSDAEMANMQH